MGVGLTNLSHQFLNFNPRQHKVIYNTGTDTFSLIGKHAFVENNCSSNLKIISKRIKAFITTYPLHTLNTSQLLHLMTNIGTINSIQDSYNNKLMANRFFYVVERLLQLVTLGFLSLRYQRFELSEFEPYLGERVLTNNFEKTVQILETLSGNSHFIITLGKYAGYLLKASSNPAIFTSYSEQQKNSLLLI